MPSAAFSRSSNNPSPMARRHEVRAVDLHTFRVPQKAGDEASWQLQHFFLKRGTVKGDSPVHWQTIAYLLYIFQGYLVGSRAKYQKARRDPSPCPVAVEWASLSLTIVRTPTARQIGHWKGVLLLSRGPACSHTARIHQEIPADAGARTQDCP